MVISRAFIPPCNLWALEVENSRTRQVTFYMPNRNPSSLFDNKYLFTDVSQRH